MPSLASFQRRLPRSKGLVVWLATLGALVPMLWLLLHDRMNPLVAAVVFLVLLVITVLNKPFGICATLIYLFLMGDIRRIYGVLFGFPKFDLLLLVGPAISLVLAVPILMRLRLTDAVSKAIFALMVVMTLEIFNPRQGPIAVGAAGAMFYLGPLLWFWIGRQYGTEALLRSLIYKVVIPIGVLAALLGLVQTYIGFLPWESAWIASVAGHYHALNLGGGFIRPFGFSVNSVEYTVIVMLASTCAFAAIFAGKPAYGFLLPLLLPALFLESSRTAIVKLLFAVAAAWALSSKGGRGWAFRLPLALAVGVGVIAFSLSRVGGGEASKGSSASEISAAHQVQGLAHPLDKKYSTAGLHSQMFVGGLLQGIEYPLGSGLGSTTLGSRKFGGGEEEESGSSEIDISDAFIALGLIGGFLYLATIVLILRRVLAFGGSASKYIGLPTLGILAAMGGAWIALGQYAISPLLWLLIGAVSRLAPQFRMAPERYTAARRTPGFRQEEFSPLTARARIR